MLTSLQCCETITEQSNFRVLFWLMAWGCSHHKGNSSWRDDAARMMGKAWEQVGNDVNRCAALQERRLSFLSSFASAQSRTPPLRIKLSKFRSLLSAIPLWKQTHSEVYCYMILNPVDSDTSPSSLAFHFNYGLWILIHHAIVQQICCFYWMLKGMIKGRAIMTLNDFRIHTVATLSQVILSSQLSCFAPSCIRYCACDLTMPIVSAL